MEKNLKKSDKFTGFSGAALKYLACITMFIDHFAVSILMLGYKDTGTTFQLFRSIGRIAFPIFVFLLVEGFKFTKDRKKYLERLLVTAVISELPFDLALTGKTVYFGHNNVIFNLFLGILMLCLLEKYEEKHGQNIRVTILIVAGIAYLSEMLKIDYGAIGILAIYLYYLARNNKNIRLLNGEIAFLFEFKSFIHLAFLFIYFYNGQRGKQNKYFFYAFYPAHLLILYLLRLYLF